MLRPVPGTKQVSSEGVLLCAGEHYRLRSSQGQNESVSGPGGFWRVDGAIMLLQQPRYAESGRRTTAFEVNERRIEGSEGGKQGEKVKALHKRCLASRSPARLPGHGMQLA